MGLYERLRGDEPKLRVHAAFSIICQFARGRIDVTRARAAMATAGRGVPLTPEEEAEVVALRNRITSIAVTGGSGANNADGKARRVMALLEVEEVFNLLDSGEYTAAEARAILTSAPQ
jgi:hypothetical protein